MCSSWLNLSFIVNIVTTVDKSRAEQRVLIELDLKPRFLTTQNFSKARSHDPLDINGEGKKWQESCEIILVARPNWEEFEAECWCCTRLHGGLKFYN